jgi:hypothetical protein
MLQWTKNSELSSVLLACAGLSRLGGEGGGFGVAVMYVLGFTVQMGVGGGGEGRLVSVFLGCTDGVGGGEGGHLKSWTVDWTMDWTVASFLDWCTALALLASPVCV